MKRLLRLCYEMWVKYIDPFWVPIENGVLSLYCRLFPAHFQQRLNESIDRGLEYFERTKDWEIDTLFVLTNFVDESFDPRLRMASDAASRYRHEWKNPFLRLIDREYDPSRDGVDCEREYTPPEKMHRLMMESVEADRRDLKEDFVAELLTMDDNGSYGTTHILLGCMFLKRFSRINHSLLDKTIGDTIPSILRKQRCARVSDIASERVAMLQWLGLHQYIEPAWIARIVFGQMSDGGWYWTRPPFRTSSYQHPTCLAIAAMMQYRKQNFPSTIPEPDFSLN